MQTAGNRVETETVYRVKTRFASTHNTDKLQYTIPQYNTRLLCLYAFGSLEFYALFFFVTRVLVVFSMYVLLLYKVLTCRTLWGPLFQTKIHFVYLWCSSDDSTNTLVLMYRLNTQSTQDYYLKRNTSHKFSKICIFV